MSNNTYDKIAKKIQEDKSVTITAFIIFLTGLLIALGLTHEDYMTSLLGYNSLPSRKVNSYVIYLVAALPQAAQWITIYLSLALSENDKIQLLNYKIHTIYITTGSWLVFWGVDGYLDYAYKVVGVTTTEGKIITAIESWILYGIGSEVLLSLSFPIVLRLTPPAVDALLEWLSEFFGVFVKSKRKKTHQSSTTRPSVGNRGSSSGGNSRPNRSQSTSPRTPPSVIDFTDFSN